MEGIRIHYRYIETKHVAWNVVSKVLRDGLVLYKLFLVARSAEAALWRRCQSTRIYANWTSPFAGYWSVRNLFGQVHSAEFSAACLSTNLNKAELPNLLRNLLLLFFAFSSSLSFLLKENKGDYHESNRWLLLITRETPFGLTWFSFCWLIIKNFNFLNRWYNKFNTYINLQEWNICY